ncbi:DUF6053 domain-containing protein [Lysobacter enzymogenes]|uniref:DUF6053 domain-containing protein n=1 Tax=Lysobacter enzymogenes TaxID=69 RepID=UPI003749F050
MARPGAARPRPARPAPQERRARAQAAAAAVVVRVALILPAGAAVVGGPSGPMLSFQVATIRAASV